MKRYVRFDRTRFFDVDFDWTSRLGLRILYDRAYLLKVKWRHALYKQIAELWLV